MKCNNICGIVVASAATVFSLISVRASCTSSFALSSSPVTSRSLFVLRSFSQMGGSSSTSACKASSSSSLDYCKSEINSNDVVVFSKTYCPYCTATKTLFQDIGVKAKVIELDTMSNGSDIQAALAEFTGQRTVPNVFIKGKHVGGNDKTQAAHKSGELQKLLSS